MLKINNIELIENIINEIIEKYHANLLLKQEQINSDENNNMFSWNIFVCDISPDDLFKMNECLIDKISESSIRESNIIPVFILSDKNTVETIQKSEQEEVKCYGRFK